MKILFAVSNDNISNSIIKKYQQKYKEIITSKSVYYFNAIIKELQKDKTYDVVIIGEDLEPISTNNYDTIDKFIFEKLDNISDEAYKANGEDIPIILICSDRRTKSDHLLVKLFGISVYNALLGNDRNIDAVCDLIYKPRSKKEAKSYYRIESDDVNYKPENESEVSETEIQSILTHYKKIGNNEKKCVESFESIASQYTDTQLRIIVKFLPMSVKAILEKKSLRYQRLMSGGTVLSNGTTYNPYKPNTAAQGQNVDLLTKDLEKPQLTKPVVIPSTMEVSSIQQQVQKPVQTVQNQNMYNPSNQVPEQPVTNFSNSYTTQSIKEEEQNNKENNNPIVSDLENVQKPVTPVEPVTPASTEQPVQKKRGRPKKVLTEEEEKAKEMATKRGRGRPRKNVSEESALKEVSGNGITTFENNAQNSNTNHVAGSVNLFEMADTNEPQNDAVISEFEPVENITGANNLVAGQNISPVVQNPAPLVNQTTQINQPLNYGVMQKTNQTVNQNVPEQNSFEMQNINPFDINSNPYQSVMNQAQVNANYNPFKDDELVNTNNNMQETSGFIARNSKVVAFVGTSKNGTSFIVNNLAILLSQKGIKTAILDLTKNKNAYYMFTDNDQSLMQRASNSIKNLAKGQVEGINVNPNLSVFTSLPGDDFDTKNNTEDNVNTILQTLDNGYSAILMDCDFETNIDYFKNATEIYLVQTMDALTIQPLTLFLSELKLKNVLDETKLRVIINKEIKMKLLNEKMIIGGMAKYNEPSMTLQRDLFNPSTIKYVKIPFEEQNYAKYLESIAICQISLGGYTEKLLAALTELANMVYPLISSGNKQNYNLESGYSPNYEKTKKGGLFGGKSKKQSPTQFSSNVNGTLDKMRSNY